MIDHMSVSVAGAIESPALSLQNSVLDALELARNYNAWISSLALPYLGEDPVEVGSGLGAAAEHWLAAGLPRITLSDVDEHALGHLRARFNGDDRVVVRKCDLLEAPEDGHSAAVAFNVVEHVRDDSAALRSIARLVRDEGAIVVFVPAFPFAMSPFDRALGHYRRYTKRSLAAAFSEAGLTVERIRYVNALGLVAWVGAMRLLRLSPRPGRALRAWDRMLVPITRAIERRIEPPFGQSLFAVGRLTG